MRSHAKAASVRSIEAGSNAINLRALGLCAVAAVLFAALLGASAARAANSYVSAGEISAGELTAPARIAVDETTGNVLVVDTAKNRVDVFDSSGPGAALLTTIGEADLSGPYGIAVDQSNGDVYVTDPGNELIRRYTTDGAPTPTYTLDAGYAGPAAGAGSEEVGSFTSAIAVDPTSGNLLVADRGNDRVIRFSAAGAFVSSFDGSDSTDGAFTNLEDLTLSPAGNIFVSDGIAGESSRVLRFSNAGAFESTLRGPAATGDAYLAYNAARPGLIVGDARECFFCTVQVHVLDPSSGAVLFNVAVPSELITGLAVDPGSGRLYAASARGEFFLPPKVAVFASQMHPELVLDAPSPVSPFSVHLSGTVNPEGVATESHFEVSKDGGTTWQKSPDASVGEGTSPVAVEADLAVEPNTSYVAKLVASNTEGAQDATPTQPFLIAVAPPETVTRPARDLAETSATLDGTINPYGLQTTYYFEYGPTAAYGTKVPAGTENTAGQGRVPKSFSRTISGLSPGATYHFRLVATSSAGTSEGSDETFTTLAGGAVPDRAYEQVTPPDKGETVVIPYSFYQASADGSAVSYTTKTGPLTTPLLPRAVAIRGTSDWESGIYTDLPTMTPEVGGLFQQGTLAISDDFEHAFVVTNRALTPGGFEEGANLYLTDIATGTYQFIGASSGSESFREFSAGQRTGKFQGGAPDFSWIIFNSIPSLLPGAPINAMYRWSESDGLEVVSVLPNGEMTSALRGGPITVYDPFSADGSRIYFSAAGGSEEGVFLREGGGPAKPVSHVPGDPSTPLPAALLGVNRDGGRYAFLTSGAKLTSDAPGKGSDLYRYDASDGSIEYLGEQVATTVESDSSEVQQGSFGIGADGQTIYFNAEASGAGFKVWRDGAVHAVFPAVEGRGTEHPSPNGRYYVGYQTVGGVPGVIQLYDAETDQHSCVSCLADGAPVPGRLPAAGGEAGGVWVSNRNARAVDDNGTVYFESTAPLVAADVNGVKDVYTFRNGTVTLISPGDQPFEATYADSSEDGSSVFFNTSQKLVGRDNDRSIDLYVSRVNGGFPAQSPPPSQECSADDCRPAPSAVQEAPAGGSEALNGPGNVKPAKKQTHCGKGKRKVKANGKVKCVKKKAGMNKKGGNR